MLIKKLSEAGIHHNRNNDENQDALCCAQDKEFCIISLADGVSTCNKAKCGAEIASAEITKLLFDKREKIFEEEQQKAATIVTSTIFSKLKQQADNDFRTIEEYSSTVASVLLDKNKKRMMTFNLGDGIIIAVGKGKCQVVAMPSDSRCGCYVTTTPGVIPKVSVRLFATSDLESVVICSDGAWKQMYRGTKLKQEVLRMLINNEYERLSEFLSRQNCFDDYSFIAIDLEKRMYGR